MRKSHAPSQRGRFQAQPVDVTTRPVVKQEVTNPVRRFQVLYNRMSTRTTQKTYENDGWLEFDRDSNYLTLRDEDGFLVCSTLYMNNMRLTEGSEIIIEPKDVKIVMEMGVQRAAEKTSRKRPLMSPDRNYQPPRQEVFTKQTCLSPKSHLASIKTERVDSGTRKYLPVEVKEEPVDDDQYNIAPSGNQVPISQSTRQDVSAGPSRVPIAPIIPVATIKQEPDEQPLSTPANTIPAPMPQVAPLTYQEIVIFCRPSSRQISTFESIYKDMKGAPDSAIPQLTEDLQENCNGPINTSNEDSGKLSVLLGLVESSLCRNESVLIVAHTEDVLVDLLEICSHKFNKPSFLLEEEVTQMIGHTGPKICIANSVCIDEVKKNNLVFHRAIAYEYQDFEKIHQIIQGPIYSLLVSRSIEERQYQREHGLISDKDLLYNTPGNYNNSDTHQMLHCNCHRAEDDDQVTSEESQDEDEMSAFERMDYRTKRAERAKIRDLCDLKHNWDHIPGDRIDQEDHLQVSYLCLLSLSINTNINVLINDLLQKVTLSAQCASSIVFLFKRHL